MHRKQKARFQHHMAVDKAWRALRLLFGAWHSDQMDMPAIASDADNPDILLSADPADPGVSK